MDGILLAVTANKLEKKGDISPFPFNLFNENKTFVFFSILFINLALVNLIDFFELEKIFSSPGDEGDITGDTMFFIVFFGLIVPIFEEFIFRFWVFEKISKAIFPLILLTLYLIYLNFYWAFNVFYFLIFLLLVVYASINKDNFGIIFLLNGTVFAIFHIVNFSGEELVSGIYYLPILFFPQFFLGVIVCFLKTFGFRYSIFYHVSYNSSLIIIEYVRLSI